MFNTLDWIIVGLYCVGIISLATYVSRNKSGSERSAEDYFLAGRSLPWWAIGASLIAANISAEQIIGMSGQGFVVGMAIAVWELTAAIALIVMAKYFLPLFLEKKINFTDIFSIVEKVTNLSSKGNPNSIEEVFKYLYNATISRAKI